eukprot:Sdes_comp10147_c0_seq1m1760
MKDSSHMDTRRLISHINQHIYISTEALSHFSEWAELKFLEIHQTIRDVDLSVSLLESKLSSICDSPQENFPGDSNPTCCSTPPEETHQSPQVSVDLLQTSSSSIENSTPPSVIEKYEKLLKVGVPRQHVEMKMFQDGIDPSLLPKSPPS